MSICIGLVLACSLTSAAAAPQGTPKTTCLAPSFGSNLWSNASSWPGGAVPGPGSCVTIPAGTTIYLDTSTASLGGLSVQGDLIMLCGDYTITSDWIQVTGLLEVGNYNHRFHENARIKLTNQWSCPSPIISHMPPPTTTLTAPVLGVEGTGVLRLIGADMGASWTRLASTFGPGQKSMLLQQAPGWESGQKIVIASTDFDMNQAETAVIQAVNGSTVQLAQEPRETHWGATEGQSFDGSGIEERAEVAMLDRKIVVEGIEGGGTSAGHTLFLNSSGSAIPRGELDSVEFRFLGNQGQLGRYPVHWHHVGDAKGSFIRNCSIHETYNRAITIHMSQNVELIGNVSYDCLGHAFYFEDGSVTGCTMRNNLGLLTKTSTTVPSDARPSTFWLHSPQNVVDDNAAAGSEAVGFWFETDHGDPNPWISFDGNVAHSNEDSGFMQDERRPQPVPASLFSDLTAYKNRRYGFWLRTYGEAIIADSQFADNRAGLYFASEGFQFNLTHFLNWGSGSSTGISKTLLIDSLIIGETANTGKAVSCEESLAGRSLPQLFSNGSGNLVPAWDALVGVEIYDGMIGIENCTFAEYRDKSLSSGSCSFDRKGGSLHQVFYYNPWAVDPRNYVEGLTFINTPETVTDKVYFRTPQGPQDPFWCTSAYQVDDGGLANVVLYDKDGSLGLSAGSCVYPVNEFLDPIAGAIFEASWNANVTSGPPATPYAQLDFAQLYSLSANSTTTVDGKPILKIAALHSLLRNELFVKAGAVLDICSTTSERPIPRIVTNVITEDIYDYYYDLSLHPSDWPVQISISLQFTEPDRWVYATIPLASQPLDEKVLVNTVRAPMASDPLTLFEGPGNEWWYDTTNQRLHLKIITGGTGSTIYDGLRSTFVVNY